MAVSEDDVASWEDVGRSGEPSTSHKRKRSVEGDEVEDEAGSYLNSCVLLGFKSKRSRCVSIKEQTLYYGIIEGGIVCSGGVFVLFL
jgi:hypothetical protein